MEPVTLTAIAIYVADKIVSQFIKEEGYGKLKKFFFLEQKYKHRIYQIITETISEFEKDSANYFEKKFPFYYSQILFDLLNQYVLFKKKNSPLLIEEFKKNENIIVPTQEELTNFYDAFIQKINEDKKIKTLYIDENYKEEIYNISNRVNEVLNVTNVILQKVSSIESKMSSSSSPIIQLRNRFEETLEIQKSYKLQGLDVFPKIDKISSRKIFVTEIISILNTKTWIALYGNIALGKTQLAVLLTEKFNSKYWIELKDFQSNVIIEVILNELSSHFNLNISSITEIDVLIEKISKGSLLVLDDLPKLDLSKPDLHAFIQFINALNRNQIKLISNSNYPILSKVKEHINASIFDERNIPYLIDDEVKEILLSYGASEEVAKILKSIVCNIAEGHPIIVNAICTYLLRQNWEIEKSILEQLFSGAYTSSLDDEIYERIVKTVSDESSRDLLYRIKVIIGKITSKEIDVVAEVLPPINHPYEKLNILITLWIQKLKSDNYEISPLIKKLKNNNLSTVSYKAINSSLGGLILSKKLLDQVEANKAIVYFIKAEEYNKAGFVLSLVLEKSMKNPRLFFDWGFDLFWFFSELPEQMDLYLRSVIRYFHISILLKENKNIEHLVAELETIVLKASKLNINIAHAALLLSVVFLQKNSQKVNEYLILALSHLEQLKMFDTEKLLTEKAISVESLIWNSLVNVKSFDDFNSWFNSFSKLTDAQRQHSLVGELGDLSSLIFCSTLFDSEAEKQNPNWELLISTYDEIIKKVSPFNIYVLIACCTKFQIRCYCAKKNHVDIAIEVFYDRIGLVSSNATAKFILYDELGRQLFYKVDNDKALVYLIEAALIDVPFIHIEKIDTFLALNEIFGMKDKQVAHEYILKAYNFQDNNEFISDVLSAKVIGELAISNWEVSEQNETFYIIEKGLEKIIFTYKPISDYQGTIIRYGHILNYYYHLTAKISLPNIDGLPYAVPFRGFFSKNNDKLLEGGFYFEQKKVMLAFLMAQSFELLDDFEFAKKWAYLCFNLNEEDILNPFKAVLIRMIVYLVIDDKYEEAILMEIDILNSVNELNTLDDLSDKLSSNLLTDIVKDRPRTTFNSFDNLLFEHTINFIVIKVLWNFLDSGDKITIKAFLENFKNLINYFENKDALNILENAFQYLIEEEKSYEDILSLADATIELATQVKLLLYLIASLKSPLQKTLQLHLGLIQRLEMISTTVTSNAPIKFIVIPFFEKFWTKKIESNRSEFFQYVFLISKGIPKYQKANYSIKLKELFKILCYHLEYEPEENIQAWMN